VPGGVDVSPDSVVVATSSGTTCHRNAICKLEKAQTRWGTELTVGTDSGRYAVGNEIDEAAMQDAQPLFGGPRDRAWLSRVAGPALGQLLSASTDGQFGGALVGYVDRETEVSNDLAHAAIELEATFVPVDPGMAVCYDAFEVPWNCLGILRDTDRVFATLAIGGVPVATAQIDVQDETGTGEPGTDREDSPDGWIETLLSEIATELPADVPMIDEPLRVATGGTAVPETESDRAPRIVAESERVAEAVWETLGMDVGTTRVRKKPAHAPARGALIAAEHADDWMGSVPSVAATDKYAIGLADTSRAVAAVAEQSDRGEKEHVPTIREGVTATVAGIEADLDKLDAEIEEMRSTLADVEEDTDPGANGDEPEVPRHRALETFHSDIDAVEEQFSNRIRALWEAVDEINERLVDISSQVEELPIIEGDIESTQDIVDDLADEIVEIHHSMEDLRETVNTVDDATATSDALATVREDLDGVATDLEQLRSEFEDTDRVSPEQLETVEGDIDALRTTVLDHARRMEGVERTASDLEDRIEHVFRDTAKAEALASLQEEVRRIRQTANRATETASATRSDVEEIAETVTDLQSELEQTHQMVDSVAGSSATRSELEEAIGNVEDTLAELEDNQQALEDRIDDKNIPSPVLFPLVVTCFTALALLAGFLAFELGQSTLGRGFAVLVAGGIAFLWLSLSEM